MSDSDFIHKKTSGSDIVELGSPPSLSAEQICVFESISGTNNVFSDDFSRVKYGTGKTMEEVMSLRHGITGRVPDLVVHPRSKAEIENILSFCNSERIPVYVFGGGSSVTLGFQAVKGGVCLVMKTHMNRVLNFSEINQTVTVEPGIMGPALEEVLNNAPENFRASTRYTCGHFPQSFEFSSVGGWIASLGSGQMSSYYGDMDRIVLSQEYVTPVGTIKTLDYPGTATGPKVNDIMKGSEGAYGILVSATLRLFRFMPENKKRFSFLFPDWENTVSAAREISQGEFGMPSLFRISDPEETKVAFKLYGIEGSFLERLLKLRNMNQGGRCLLLGSSEGEKYFSRNIKQKVKKICRRHGAVYITGLPVKRWEQGRFSDPYMREDLNDFGILIDTLESGVTWENFHRLHTAVRRYIKSRPHTICMTHASHFYPQGTNLYFIFITRIGRLEEYKKFQECIIDEILRSGGSLSHHHGVGKMIAPWMENHLGTPQMNVLRALKRHFDPNQIMNPGGTLGLDIPEERRKVII